MNLAERVDLMVKLGSYLTADGPQLKAAKEMAYKKNMWFILQFVDLAVKNIAGQFLSRSKLEEWIRLYHLDDNIVPKTVGVVMAGNIPLVGFHDFLCVFISGHKQKIKLSEKDDQLFPYILKKLTEWNSDVADVVVIADILLDCEAFIATGSRNSGRYFEHYFGQYPSVIRTNKTSVAILDGQETSAGLELLADDIQTFFGLGCRSVTSIFVPDQYDFVPLVSSFKNYSYFSNHSKYKNNYDYNLTLLIMNNRKYMAGDGMILVEDKNIFSPVSQLHYAFYDDATALVNDLKQNTHVQCIYGKGAMRLGTAQEPALGEYADGIDTMQFLLSI